MVYIPQRTAGRAEILFWLLFGRHTGMQFCGGCVMAGVRKSSMGEGEGESHRQGCDRESGLKCRPMCQHVLGAPMHMWIDRNCTMAGGGGGAACGPPPPPPTFQSCRQDLWWWSSLPVDCPTRLGVGSPTSGRKLPLRSIFYYFRSHGEPASHAHTPACSHATSADSVWHGHDAAQLRQTKRRRMSHHATRFFKQTTFFTRTRVLLLT